MTTGGGGGNYCLGRAERICSTRKYSQIVQVRLGNKGHSPRGGDDI